MIPKLSNSSGSPEPARRHIVRRRVGAYRHFASVVSSRDAGANDIKAELPLGGGFAFFLLLMREVIFAISVTVNVGRAAMQTAPKGICIA